MLGENSNSQTSYSPYAYPDQNYSNLSKPKEDYFLILSKVGNFTELLPERDGIGKYHINHHVGYFEPKSEFNSLTEIDRLFSNFGTIFSKNNIAVAVLTKYKFKNHNTIKFTIGGTEGGILDNLAGVLHDDWVSLQMEANGQSFFASTLKREWMENSEIVVSTGSQLFPWPPPGDHYSVKEAIKINQRHFLAGKRSWKIGYDDELKLLYLETAAFERFSSIPSLVAGTLIESQNKIIEIWTNLIENYAIQGQFTLVPHLPDEEYELNRNVAYKERDHDSAKEALNSSWFSKVLAKHPGLLI